MTKVKSNEILRVYSGLLNIFYITIINQSTVPLLKVLKIMQKIYLSRSTYSVFKQVMTTNPNIHFILYISCNNKIIILKVKLKYMSCSTVSYIYICDENSIVISTFYVSLLLSYLLLAHIRIQYKSKLCKNHYMVPRYIIMTSFDST